MLHVNYKHIPFWKDKFLVEQDGKTVEDPWVFVMGIYSMHVGINDINEKTAPEFFMRAKLIDACFDGGFMREYKDGKAVTVGISFDVIERFIGVTTNASAYTEPQFFKHLRTDVVPELRRLYEHMRKERGRQIAEKLEATLEGERAAT